MIVPGPERWARIEAVLDAALDRPAPERAQLLDELCGDDIELRREVERLLRSIDSAERAFERPPVEMVEAAAATAQREQLETGERVGAWRVIDLLGRGGMGAVYLAERADGAFERQVALKIVKRGMDTDEILRRFRRERQILARLEHNNIAGLLDGGVTSTGVPYFAMELARGQPIDEWCDTHRLTVEQRLRLFLPVCDAVGHAHRSLVVHRDLKPGNILIADGEPKLLDFGIAKVLHAEGEEDDEPATRLQERRLTPHYAAPEQLRNEPTTTATDVYALGVILYELLTGRPPYRIQGGIGDIERIVCTEQPRNPSAVAGQDGSRRDGPDTQRLAELRGTRPDVLRSTLHGDLDAIIMKALEKEPERRYVSVEAFAADIRNHLEGRPVLARPASRWYHARKFIGRNRTVVALSAVAALALVIGSGLALWQAARARDESLRAQLEAARSAAARDYLIDLFADLNPDALRGQRQFTLEQLIALSVANLAALEEHAVLSSSIVNAVGSVVFNLGDYQKADSLFTVAANTLAPGELTPDLAESMMGLGVVSRMRRDFPSAIAWFATALYIRQQLLGEHDSRIPATKRELAFAFYNADDLARAETLYDEVLASDSATADVHAAALEGLGDLRLQEARDTPAGDSLGRREAYAAAAVQYEDAIATYAELHQERTSSVGLIRLGLGEAYSGLGRHEEAVATTEEALSILIGVYGFDHPIIVEARFFSGLALAGADTVEAAVAQFEACVALGERVSGPDAMTVARARLRLGPLLVRLDRHDDARAHLEAARGSLARILARESDDETAKRNLASVERELGALAALDGQWAEAERWFRAAVPRWEDLGDVSRARSAAAELVALFEQTGRPDSAAAWRLRGY